VVLDIQPLAATEATVAVVVVQLVLPLAGQGIILVPLVAAAALWHKQINQVVMAEPIRVVAVAVEVIIT
jgi:hypothetical protein